MKDVTETLKLKAIFLFVVIYLHHVYIKPRLISAAAENCFLGFCSKNSLRVCFDFLLRFWLFLFWTVHLLSQVTDKKSKSSGKMCF